MKTNRSVLALACGLVAGSIACSNDVAAPSSDVAAVSGSTCSPGQVARMVVQPIIPGRSIAGIDLRTGPGGTPSTIDYVAATHCMGRLIADQNDRVTLGYGDANEIMLDYVNPSRNVDSFVLNKGYRGELRFRSRPHALADASKPNPFGDHTYTIAVGRPLLRDGVGFSLNWRTKCSEQPTDCWEQQSAELFDAIMFTFAPDAPSTQESCIRQASCLAKVFPDGDAVFGVRPLGIYFTVPSVDAAQPAPSTPVYVYGFIKPPVARSLEALEALEEAIAPSAK